MSLNKSEFVVEAVGKDRYRVRGVSPDQLKRALALLSEVEDFQGEVADLKRGDLVAAMMLAGETLVPEATVDQARRQADLRQKLLASGYHTYDTLSELRGDSSIEVTRTWVSRRRKRNQLFTVEVQGRTLLPGFQFTETGAPRQELSPILSSLSDRGFSGWQTWAWFYAGNTRLDGQIPVQILDDQPDLVAWAAARGAVSATA